MTQPGESGKCPCGVSLDAETHVEKGPGFTHVSKPIQESAPKALGAETVIGALTYTPTEPVIPSKLRKAFIPVRFNNLSPEYQALILGSAENKEVAQYHERQASQTFKQLQAAEEKVKALEAERDRLRGALEKIRNINPDYDGAVFCRVIAQQALANEVEKGVGG